MNILIAYCTAVTEISYAITKLFFKCSFVSRVAHDDHAHACVRVQINLKELCHEIQPNLEITKCPLH